MTDQLDKEWLVRAVCATTTEVFSTMLGVEPEPGAAYATGDAGEHVDGVVSLIGLAGDWMGAGSLCCSTDAACDLSSRLLMAESSKVDEEVLDAIGEITNMIIGNLKNVIEESLGPLGLSIPTVICGRDFRARSVSGKEWTVVPFTVAGRRVEVGVCLARHVPAGSNARLGTHPTH